MKKAHILNIGFPKCSTMWLWKTLIHNNSVSRQQDKENNSLIRGVAFEEYCKQYTDDVTANFCPMMIAVDRYIIKQLASVPQVRPSIIIRDPIFMLWSMYNFLHEGTVYYSMKSINPSNFENFCYTMYDSKWFVSLELVVNRWRSEFGDRLQIFMYDDLKKDNHAFFQDYCARMGIDPGPGLLLPPDNMIDFQENNSFSDIDRDLLESIQNEMIKFKKSWMHQ